jgi:tetratricopeptide (TPR) repeat protein
VTHDRIAWISETRGDPGVASAESRAALAAARRLASVDPNSTAAQWNLGFSHGRLGDLLLSTGDLAGAQRAYEARRGVMDRLARGEPDNPDWQYERGISHARLGLVLESRGDFAAAGKEYEACIEIAERVAAADPANSQARHNLAMGYRRLAEVHVRLGNSAQALAGFRLGRLITAALLEETPGMGLLTGDLALFDRRISALQRGAHTEMSSPVMSSNAFAKAPAVALANAAELAPAQLPDNDGKEDFGHAPDGLPSARDAMVEKNFR